MPFSIAGPASPALPSPDGISRATDRISSGLRIENQLANSIYSGAEAALSGRLDTLEGETTINIHNAIHQTSALQTADLTLSRGKSITQRIQELSVQSGNSALSETDQRIIQEEISSLFTDLDDLFEDARFNNQDLFGATTVESDGVRARIDEIRNSESANSDKVAELQDELSALQADVGAKQYALGREAESSFDALLNIEGQRGQISDFDLAEEIAILLREKISFEASVKVFDQQRLAEQSIINLLN